jgi:8-oxo-dGTP pyrophosphatase MutT (NUDIX family)
MNQKLDKSREMPKWRRLSHKTVYKGRIHVVEHDVILPNGQASKYEVDHHESYAVATLVSTPNDEVILTYQYRFPLDQWIYDLPGGGKQKDETIEQAAARECQEEIGIRPKILTRLMAFYVNPGRSELAAHIFFCNEYEDAPIDQNDPSEQVEKVIMPFTELQVLIAAKEIVDPLLLIAWYTARDKGLIALEKG